MDRYKELIREEILDGGEGKVEISKEKMAECGRDIA